MAVAVSDGPGAAPERADAPAGLDRRDAVPTPDVGALSARAPAMVPAPGASAEAGPVQRALAVPLDDPAFPQALGLTLARLADEGVQEARLQLHPAEMGPVAVQIRLDGQTATVDLQAALAGTREVLQEALPALADAFAAEGLTLGGSSVGADAGASAGSGRDEGHAAARTPQSATGRERAGAGEDAGGTAATGRVPRPVSARTDGRLDLYA
jgi:flagellar hook-length control protein FliK